jgi:ABC-type transport system involved in cytochrome c biogenesis permease component
MSNRRTVDDTPIAPSGAPAWWLVFTSELRELWMGGKAPVLLLIFSVLLGIMTWVMASNSELSLIPPQEMVYETTKAAIAVGLFISLIIGADSISGERERATLEGLLLTPTSRRQLVFGKFLAGVSPWPVAMLIAIPYMKVLSQGDEVFQHALPWGALLGTILAPAFTALGMLTSFWSNSNKTSLFTALGLYILFLIPTQLPGRATTGAMGMLLNQVNPIQSTFVFLSRILVNNRTVVERAYFLASPIAFAILVYVLLFWYAGPGLRLEGGRSAKLWSSLGRRLGFAATAGLLLVFLNGSMASAQQPSARAGVPADANVAIAIDADYKIVKTGDRILYNTVVTNQGTVASRSLVVAMNIINLNAAGDIVDPEDWSPQRTQYIDSVPPGQSKSLSWRVNAILDGNYLVYMVLVPEPEGKEATSRPVASSGLHLTVTPFTKLNPGGVLPYAIGGPVILLTGMMLVYRARRRKIDMGSDAE